MLIMVVCTHEACCALLVTKVVHCAGQQLTMAQKISRGLTKVAKQREQEDAQEFLTSLLNLTHDELLKLRAMYGTQGQTLPCK